MIPRPYNLPQISIRQPPTTARMIGRGRGRGRGKPIVQPLRRPGQVAVITYGNEPLVDLSPIEERFVEAKGKEALPTGPNPSAVCCEQCVHQGSLGLYQPLIPVVVHGLRRHPQPLGLRCPSNLGNMTLWRDCYMTL